MYGTGDWMEELLRKYADKLARHGLCDDGAPLLGGLDAQLTWNRKDKLCGVLEDVACGLNINSILFARPAEPYFSILNYLCRGNNQVICPDDTETRTFLHDIPVCREFGASGIVDALRRRKSVVIPGQGIVTFGVVSPEQAFVSYSSVCFSMFVKFFVDFLYGLSRGDVCDEQVRVFEGAVACHKKRMEGLVHMPCLEKGVFKDRGEVIDAIVSAGRATVDYRLVDSFFGNVSYRLEDTVYISQTGSSLDELSGCVDACPLDNSSCAGITASSELSAHKGVYDSGGNMAILHGHPKFCVIMSLFCEKYDCRMRGSCHVKCPHKRFIGDVPVVPGEVGTGVSGLCNTLVPAMKGRRGVIVWGHGLFTVGKVDFCDAFCNLVDIEKMCFDEYMGKVRGFL